MKLGELARLLGGTLNGSPDIEISGPAKIEFAQSNEITFVSNKKYKHFLETTKAGAVIVDNTIDQKLEMPHIVVNNAYMGFLMLLRIFEPEPTYDFKEISKQSYISNSAHILKGSDIGPFVYIGKNTHIGKNCTIYPNVTILDNVTIGDNCILYPQVSIREGCKVGNNVILHNGVVIGSDGFGFAPHEGKQVKIPQIGNVVIEDDVELGANTVIDRATIGSTIIKQGVKLDNLIQIAHNCEIGAHTVIAAQSGMSGSTIVGKNVTIAGQVGTNGHLKIGDNAIIAGKSGVTKSVEGNAVYFGLPAVPMMQKKRVDISLRKLPEKIKELNQLKVELKELKQKLDLIEKGNTE